MRSLILILLMLVPVPAFGASLEVMVGQMLMTGFRGTSVDAESPIVRDIENRHLGGVVLFDYDVERKVFDRNIESPEQVKRLTHSLQSRADIPLFIAVDQEGGKVQRLKERWGFPETPSAQKLGLKGPAASDTAGRIVGRMLSQNGINMDFAPVVDVNVNPKSPAIGALGRSFSADPQAVADNAAAFAKGLRGHGVIPCLKHFPGHGSAMADSHKGLTDVTDTWSRQELVPYQTLIDEGYVGMIMTAHVFNATLDPKYPATLSDKVIGSILRQRLSWDGVVITDDMDMRAIRDSYGMRTALKLAIRAGADIMLYGNNLRHDPQIMKKAYDTILDLVRSGEIPEARIRQSFERIMKLKERMKEAL
ncbi:glycoside hydrolase family 3 protein [Desulfovibrio oxyclinae]|uniref:glycoside hydrolase family 3 protein n=1 Tax=Desulfovibrio oxyclinae TaxID=63560 RepID=UPI000475500F|nr:glycoside hydrolase family 3 protein [Desulfovibrio oxyclinae]